MAFEITNRDQASGDPEDVLSLMDDLLDRERLVLLNGDLEQATRLFHDKEALFKRFALLPGKDAVDVERLRAKTERNQQLLLRAIEGIQAVNDRIQMLRRTRETLETYDRTCRKTTIAGAVSGTLERRA
jgi:hypothetical protein